MEDHIAQEVVSARAVTSAAADKSLVPKSNQHAIAVRAFEVVPGERHPKPALQHSDVQGRLIVKTRCLAGSSLQPKTCSVGPDEIEVGAPAHWSGAGLAELGGAPFVDGLRERFLRAAVAQVHGELFVVNTLALKASRAMRSGAGADPSEVCATCNGSSCWGSSAQALRDAM